MDDYKKNVIEVVRSKPLLWDPKNKDYKNKERRKQVWEEIKTRMPPPSGCSLTAKGVWDQLMRGFCNVLKKKEKKSGSGATVTSDKRWKFEKDLQFLLPVKKTRPTSGSLTVTPTATEDSISLEGEESVKVEEMLNGSETPEDEDFVIEMDRDHIPGEETMEIRREGNKRKRTMAEDNILALIKNRLAIKNAESSRFLFLKSLLPMVEELSTENFMDFQITIIQELKKLWTAQKQPEAMYHHLPGTSTPQASSSVPHHPCDLY